jgi:hypothetical protein
MVRARPSRISPVDLLKPKNLTFSMGIPLLDSFVYDSEGFGRLPR